MNNSLSYKTKQFFWLIIKLSIVIGCGYFIWQKLTSNSELHFNEFYQNLKDNRIFSTTNITLLFLFTFLNWFLEITKWKELVSFVQKITFFEATKQSLASLTTSLITPNRIGEYGAKALYFNKPLRKQILGLNLVGNFYQMLMTLIFGVIGFGYFVSNNDVFIDYQLILKFLILGLFVVITLFFTAKHFNYKGYSFEKVKNFINRIPTRLNSKVSLISFLRFVVFSHQFYFLLIIFKVDISYLEAISAITTVYFISSIIPMLSLFDVILKGTVAIWVFSFLGIEPMIILTITTLMWILNFVFPAIIGSYFVITFKPKLAA